MPKRSKHSRNSVRCAVSKSDGNVTHNSFIFLSSNSGSYVLNTRKNIKKNKNLDLNVEIFHLLEHILKVFRHNAFNGVTM